MYTLKTKPVASLVIMNEFQSWSISVTDDVASTVQLPNWLLVRIKSIVPSLFAWIPTRQCCNRVEKASIRFGILAWYSEFAIGFIFFQTASVE